MIRLGLQWAATAGVLLSVGLLGRRAARGLPLRHPTGWFHWARSTPPSDVTTAVATAIVVALGTYVLAALTLVAVVRRRPAPLRRRPWPVRHLLAVGTGLASLGPLAATAGASPVATPASSPPSTPAVAAGPAAAHLVRAPRLWRVAEHRRSPAAPKAPVRRAGRSPTSPSRSLRTAGWWVVAPGDSLWRIAEVHLERNAGAPPAPAQVSAYWARLVRANPQLRDPDLILPGERVRLPER